MQVWAWLKKWGLAIAGGLLAILTAVFFWRRAKNALGEVTDKLVIAEATKEIASLRATRAEVEKRVGERDESIAHLDQKIEAQRQRVLEAHIIDPELSDEDVAARLRQVLGE